MSYLEINDIMFNYYDIKGIIEVINGISFNINEGELVSIVGPSGCGKSTLLNLINGLISPIKGEITYKNCETNTCKYVFGYMLQNDSLFEWLSVYDNVKLGLKIKKQLSHDNIKKVDNLLKLYNIDKFKNFSPNQLSGGMRQRVALIRTLAIQPEILLLDEPFSALDYQTRLRVCDEIFTIIKEQNKTAIMVTHDITEAISCSNKIIVLTKRPAKVKRIIDIKFDPNLSPLERRNTKEFTKYFNQIYKEIELND